ncbi:glycosyl transferase family 1 [Pseudomonas sp. TTU2014-096BSC]|nr:glycosyl transferase family 1 [Pseudomonas sp. TTU2014-096BSC]
MKIIYLHQYFNTPDMSGGTRSYEMARRLVAAGHDVQMITSSRVIDGQSTEWFTTIENGINVHWLPVPYSNHMSYRDRIIAFIRFAVLAMGKAKELDGDVVFATSTPLTIAIPAVLAVRKKKIPLVFEVRDLWPELPVAMKALRNPVLIWLARKMELWAYRNSEAIIALSPGMRDGVVKSGYPAERIAIIPNSSDNFEFAYDRQAAAQFRAQREWLQDRPLLVYTGTFGRINGVGFMVALAKEILTINSDIRILLVGDGQEKAEITKQAEQAGVLRVNLFIEESLPKRDIPALLSAANMASSLFIDLPEMQANSANKFFDALASGTPVLLNYGGWQHELLVTKRCGLALWGRPIEEAAKEVAARITDENWMEQAGRAARELAETAFDRDKLAAQFGDVIGIAVSRQGRGAAEIAPGNYDD